MTYFSIIFFYNQNSDFTFRVIFEKKKIKPYRTKMMRKSR